MILPCSCALYLFTVTRHNENASIQEGFGLASLQHGDGDVNFSFTQDTGFSKANMDSSQIGYDSAFMNILFCFSRI